MYIEKYKIIKNLGKGNMAQVYLALDEDTGIYYAIKIVINEDDSYENKREALIQECNVLKRLNDRRMPYVVRVFDSNEYTALVMEYIEGISLEKYLRENVPLGKDKGMDIINQIVDIMCYLHSRRPAIIYRDLKPENMIITGEGIIKIIDFGAAAKGFGKVSTRISYGTFGYCSKEQLNNSEITTASDVYSMGAIFSYIVTGINPALPPFKVNKLSYFPDYSSERFVKILDKCIEEDANNRFKNAMEVRTAIDNLKESRLPAEFSAKIMLYYFELIALIIISFTGLYYANIKICIISLICNLISYAISRYFENKNYMRSFIRKRCYNILWTEKKYIGLF